MEPQSPRVQLAGNTIKRRTCRAAEYRSNIGEFPSKTLRKTRFFQVHRSPPHRKPVGRTGKTSEVRAGPAKFRCASLVGCQLARLSSHSGSRAWSPYEKLRAKNVWR